MSIDTSIRSRRAVLAAAMGGAAAAAAASLSMPGPSRAADGDPITIGELNLGTSTTTLTNTATAGTALVGNGNAGATGVRGRSTTGVGVEAMSIHGYGLYVSSGRIKVEQVAGVATIKQGRRSVSVSPGVNVTGKAFVLLSPRNNVGSRGLWFTLRPTKDQFVIHMSSRRSRPTRIAWFLMEYA